MPNNAAAIWSAVAASFAALSSFLMMLIQRRNLLESVRPELVLTGWSRTAEGEGDAALDIIAFQSIRNVGRGVALRLIPYSLQLVANERIPILSSSRLPLLAPNETGDVNARIHVWWKDVQADKNGFKRLPVEIKVLCWDSRDMRHETRYGLFVAQLPVQVRDSNDIAPGVHLTSRTTITRPTCLIRLRMRLGRIPGLGRLFREEW